MAVAVFTGAQREGCMDALWRIRLLGGLSAEGRERAVTRFRTQKTAALLAYLAYYCDRSHARELLMEILWPEDDIDSARNKLRLALSSLRRQLEPPGIPAGAVVVADRSFVALNQRAVTTDVVELETALESARRAQNSLERAQILGEAVELYRGELLPGFYEDWMVPERERLAEIYLQALRELVTHLERSGDFQRALEYARRAVGADPLREEAHRDLIRLLAAAGQTSAALQQYRELERILREAGEVPSAEARQLGARLQTASDPEPSPSSPHPAAPIQPPTRAVQQLAAAPVGTVTFLLTDIAGSTALWEKTGDAIKTTLATHHALLRREFRRHGGYEVKEAGDSFLVAFSGARNALAGAIAGQEALRDSGLRVRMALHTGDVELEEEGYRDLTLHHASRLLMAAHGGQIVCSEVTAGLLRSGRAVDASAELDAETPERGVRLVDLGVYRLRDIITSERLFQVEYPGMPQRQFPPLKAEAGFAGNLPLQFTRFFGREKEIARLCEMLLGEGVAPAGSGTSDSGSLIDSSPIQNPKSEIQNRLVTLTGPGGSGKTRLALEVAKRLMEAFRGAVWFVPLADLSDPKQIAEAIREALRLPRASEAEPFQQVIEGLSSPHFASDRRSLLLLDNFEHVVAEGALLVRDLLERVSTVLFLVTSRERLGLEGEREYEVLPLPAPPNPDVPERLTLYESVQLFVDRAQAAQPDFQVTNGNAAAVAELCHRLEGIPLALELAAAWAKVLSPAQMLTHLEHRLDFLVSRRRGAAERHRTLRAAIDWSYQLLPPELQRLFARLSIFHGGFTLEAAQAICGDAGFPAASDSIQNPKSEIQNERVLDALASLVDKSLLRHESGEAMDRPPSFVMLETIREYAQECLERSGEAPALRRRFASYFHVTGGTLPLNTGSYVVRQADVDLHEALSRGELCTVLTNRQMGKSSLMVRTAVRLRQEGAAVAIADLTAIRGNQTAEEWHLALLDRIGQQLDIEGKLEEVWLAQAHRGLRERWMAALREVALPAVGVRCSVFGVRTGPAPSRTEHRTPNTDRPCRLVLFIDEIDAVRALPFSPDDLFAVIRECYDRRAEEPEFYRLTFCLLGVAAPDELIRDPHATPFDIGRRIVLKDFTEAEAASLIPGLGRPEPLGRVLLQRVLYWTAGHPYLTLRLCRAVAEEAAVTGPAGVDRVCDALLLSPRARERDDNLLFVRARLLQSPGDAVGDLLALYRQVLHGQRVPDDRTNPLINLLQLSGIVGGVDGHLRVRNRIYERVFDREWVDLDLSGRREQGSPR